MSHRKTTYDLKLVEVEDTGMAGIRIDRIHQKNTVVQPKMYSVIDRNLPSKGKWYVQIMPKWMNTKARSSKEIQARVLSIYMVPNGTSNKMVGLTRRSITFQACSVGRFKHKPYCHLSFRPLNTHGGKRTVARGQRDELPEWVRRQYQSKIRLRKTVQGRVTSQHKVGKRMGLIHDNKQVVIFDRWDDADFIKYFFALRVYSEHMGYTFNSDEE